MSKHCLLLVLFLGGTLPCVAEEQPRYRLQVGQELAYSGQGEFKSEGGGGYTMKNNWRVWVVKANADGSWRLILRHGNVLTQRNSPRPEDVSFAWCDLHPDGRLVENDSFGFRMVPASLLVALPKDETQARQGWSTKDERMDETYVYRLQGGETGKTITLGRTRESPMNVIYGASNKDTITFDRERGLPVQIDAENEQNYGFKGKGKGTMKLDEVKTRDAEWCQRFAAEAERYFAAQDAYGKAGSGRHLTAAQMRTDLDKAVADLKTVRAGLQMPELQKQVDELLAKHEQIAQYRQEEAAKREKVLGQPAPEWDTTDLEGKKHALKDYRGKVVVLDFWYRGCGWCVRAMPQMKEITTHFKDKPVVVFGMNTDPKEEDAKFVIEKMGLNYNTLKGIGVPEKYGVRGFPTLIIIDGEGKVRDIHVGYSPKLKEEVIKSIEELLTKKS